MPLQKHLIHGILITGLLTGLALALATRTAAHDDAPPPTPAQITFAQQTSDLLLATLFAALLQEFAETTPANVEQGKQSISLVFNDANKAMRLVGTLHPLRANDRPRDTFERKALALAMTGQNYTAVEAEDEQWSYRRSVALSNFHDACQLCHTNFGPMNPAQWVGALMLRVPIK